MQRCKEKAPEELHRAVEEFNRGDWFECHETLEELWVGEKGELRDFYQGLLQIAAALHHWRDGNYKGAVLLLERGRECLGRVSKQCQGVDLAPFLADTGRFAEELAAAGEGRMSELGEHLIPKLRLEKASCRG